MEMAVGQDAASIRGHRVSSAVTRGIRSKRIPGIRYIAVAIRIVSQPPAIS